MPKSIEEILRLARTLVDEANEEKRIKDLKLEEEQQENQRRNREARQLRREAELAHNMRSHGAEWAWDKYVETNIIPTIDKT